MLQPVDRCQQTAGVLGAAEQVGRFLAGLVLGQRDDHHGLVPGPGDDNFLMVVNNGVEGLGIVSARLRVSALGNGRLMFEDAPAGCMPLSAARWEAR